MNNKDLYNEFIDKEYRLKHYVPYYFEAVTKPNMLTIENIMQQHCLQWIEIHYKERIVRKAFHRFSDEPLYEEVSYLLKEDILLHIHSDIFIDILFFDEQLEGVAQKIADELLKFRKNT